jgi:predicted phage-related endonuclease
MKIHDVTQGSEEWLALRKSYFTGSALGEWLLDGDRTKTSRKAWQNAIWNKLGELSQDDEPNFPNWAMKRGTELEPLARAAYERHTGFKVTEVGFISHDCDGFGVSPDGLVMDRAEDPNRTGMHHGLELKCPVARTMLKWLDAGTLPDEHKLQVHASLAASGLQRWDFFAYHPELVPLHIIVERDEFTEQVLAGLLKLSDDYSAAKAKLAGWIATPTSDTP